MSAPGGGHQARLGVIELLNRAGHLTQRVTWDGRPLRIGRAYDNDLVVADPFVCAHHLELRSEDGRPVAHDLGSVNGTYAGRREERVDRVELTEGLTLHFGHSQIRFHAAGSTVAPALRDTARHGILGLMGSPVLVMLASALALAMLVLNEYLATAGEPTALTIAGEIAYPVIGLLAWAGFWALLNRLLSLRANFHIHCTIALLGVTALFAVAQLLSVTAFAMGWGEAVWWLKLSGRIAVLAVIIYSHLRYALHSRGRQLVAAATVASLMLFGAPATGELIDRHEFSSLPYLEPLLWPPRYRIVDGESPEAFFERAGALRDAAAREAQHPNSAGSGSVDPSD